MLKPFGFNHSAKHFESPGWMVLYQHICLALARWRWRLFFIFSQLVLDWNDAVHLEKQSSNEHVLPQVALSAAWSWACRSLQSGSRCDLHVTLLSDLTTRCDALKDMFSHHALDSVNYTTPPRCNLCTTLLVLLQRLFWCNWSFSLYGQDIWIWFGHSKKQITSGISVVFFNWGNIVKSLSLHSSWIAEISILKSCTSILTWGG